jgi:hypothetical protein
LKKQTLLSVILSFLLLSSTLFSSINPNSYLEKHNKLSQAVYGLYGRAGGLSTYQLLNLEEPVTLGAMAIPLANIAKVRNAGATVTFINDGKVGSVVRVSGVGEAEIFLQSATNNYNSYLTNSGRAATKHPEHFGFKNTEELKQVYNTDAKLNELGTQKIQEVLNNGVRTTGSSSRYGEWVTYTLPDGTAASWYKNGEFIGFRGIQK